MVKGSGVKRVGCEEGGAGKGGHQQALRILNMRSTYNFGPDFAGLKYSDQLARLTNNIYKFMKEQIT